MKSAMIAAIVLAASLPDLHQAAAAQVNEGVTAGAQGREEVVARLRELGVQVSLRQVGTVAFGLRGDGSPLANGTDEAFALVARIPEIEQVTVYRPAGMTGQGLRSLSALPNLRVLVLDGQNLWPADFVALAEFRKLECLRLSRYGVTDEVLAHIATLPKLKRLEIGEPIGPGIAPHRMTAEAVTRLLEKAPPLEMLVALGMPIDDAGMAHLKRSTDMEKFWTDSPLVTAAGWQNIGGMRKLRDLYARGTGFDDAAMLLLANMPELESLMLDGTRITDAGMPALAGLVAMTDLGVKDTRVTDAGMVHLSGMEKLRNLYVGGTAVTTKGLAFVPRKERMTMMRVGRRPLTPEEYRDVRQMFPRSEIFDPAGFWSPERIRRAAEE
jgi:internalin A